ncbi:Predicted N-acetyltransferase YhbS [Arboricoccus pini]|uniref:Predicted N-acetyltransferase YhbS n=1 Tax=Arboricoccus pini TaxID=1963835 RepID=A0A212QXY2_9PROT|nr:N-acetyltransferase [Arboricoccus pini]SNB64572.1 Predicted N-acetyltransferase YhbS [Arboricoccus pini]
MYDLTLERPEDALAIEDILDRAFGPDRQKKVSYRYRVGVAPIAAYCMVARDQDRIVATIRYWPIRLSRRKALLLGPVAVDPALQSQGIGRALIHATLARVRAAGPCLVFLVGDPAYYGQFGFNVVPPRIVMPDEDPGRLQCLSLRGASLPDHGARLYRDALPLSATPSLEGSPPIEPGQDERQDSHEILVAQHRFGHLAQAGS